MSFLPQTGVRFVALGIGDFRRDIVSGQNALNAFENTAKQVSATATTLGSRITAFGNNIANVGKQLTVGLTLPIAAAGAAFLKAGIDFEDAFAGVTKTVEGVSKGFKDIAEELYGTADGLTEAQKAAVFANDSFGELTELGASLRKDFRQLALEIPISASELSRIGQIAGQLGVPLGKGGETLLEFTKNMALLGVTTDLTAEQAATSLAKIANIAGVASEDFADFSRNAANAIVALGNNFATTEPEIVSLSFRIAGAGRALGLTTQEVFAFSAALSAAGVRAELGGSAVSRILLEISSAVADGGDQLKEFASITGLTTEAFSDLVRNNPVEAFKQVTSGLATMQEEGTLTSDTMKELGLNSIRLRDVINRLGPDMGVLNDAIGVSNAAWDENIALQEEAQKRFKTIRSQLILLKNRFVDLGITITDLVADDLAGFIGGINKILDIFSNMDRGIQRQIVRFAGLLAVLGPVTFAFGKLFAVFGGGLQIWERLFRSINIFKGVGGSLPGLFGGLFGGITSLFSGASGVVGNISSGLLGLFGNVVSSVLGPLSDLFLNLGGKLIISLFTGFGSGIRSLGGAALGGLQSILTTIIGTIFTPIAGFFTNILTSTLFKPVRLVVGFVANRFADLGKVIVGTLSVAGKALGQFSQGLLSVVGKLPGFASSLVGNLLGPLKALPKILALVAAGFIAVFAPKVITNAVKNFQGVLDAISAGVKKFTEDLKKFGVEKAILLLFGGGSTGSGNEGLILQLGKALGATESAARKFSFAMGTAAFWAISIVKATTSFVRTLFIGKKATDDLAAGATNTSDRLVTLAENLAKLFEGFFVGWVSSFDEIKRAFEGFKTSVEDVAGSLGALFDSVFGVAKQGTDELSNTLEPGVQSAARGIGESIGAIVGRLVTLTLQGISLILQFVSSVIDAIKRLVDAYEAEGVAGIFNALGTILAGIWRGAITAAGLLWDSVKPELETFLDNAIEWFTNTAVPGIVSAASKIADALKFVFGGGEITREEPVFFAFRDLGEGAKESLGLVTSEVKRQAEETGTFLGESLSNIEFIPTGDTQQTTQQFSGLLNIFKNAIDSVAAWLKDEAWPNYIKPALEGFIGLVQTFITEKIPEWTSWLKTNAIEPFFSSVGTEVKDAIDTYIIKPAEEEISKLPETILNKLGVLKPSTPAVELADESNLRFITEAYSQQLLEEANAQGVTLSDELTAGIVAGNLSNEQITELSTLSWVNKGILDPLTSRLEIESPSQATYRMGKSVADGLVSGMDDNAVFVETSATNIANSVLSIGTRIMEGFPTIFAAVSGITTLFTTMQLSLSNSVNLMVADISRLIMIATAGMGAMSALNMSVQTAPAGSVNNNTTNNNNFAPTVNQNTTGGQGDGLLSNILRLYNIHVLGGVG